MNKKTKGLIAGVAGAAILAGSGGTFALWQLSEGIGGGSVVTGELSLGMEFADIQDRSELVVGPAGLLVPNFRQTGTLLQAYPTRDADDLFVPGDVWVARWEVDAGWEGTNLAVALYIDEEPVVVTEPGNGNGDDTGNGVGDDTGNGNGNGQTETPVDIWADLDISAQIVRVPGATTGAAPTFFAEVTFDWSDALEREWTDELTMGVSTPVFSSDAVVVLEQIREAGADTNNIRIN